MDNQVKQVATISEMANLLKILSEPNRLGILEKIMDGVQCNCELGDALQIAPNLISHHLSVLRDAGLIETERDPLDARWVYYSININKLEELRMVCNEFFDPKRVKPRMIACGPSFSKKLIKN
ncbi:MAG: metalloregulator ArsR/SmtB family transcription factor [Brevefilum sp.]|nr:metalloregulator ArsR/SmtB family transcription factor [Brevefilum sp.]